MDPLGIAASLNKRPIIHPKLNNRYSLSIVSFPRKTLERFGVKIGVHTSGVLYAHVL